MSHLYPTTLASGAAQSEHRLMVMRWLDKIGLALSGICLIHCLVMPVVLMMMPFTLQLIDHDLFHEWIFWPILGVAVFAFFRGYRTSKRVSILVLGLAGIVLLASAHSVAVWLGTEAYEYVVTLCGSVLLITAHAKNLRSINHFHHHIRRLRAVAGGGNGDCLACEHH